jgi:multiple sugar transport system permease protein
MKDSVAKSNTQTAPRNTYNKKIFKASTIDRLFGLALILPAIFVVGFTTFFPVLKSIVMSFFDYKLSASKDYHLNNFQNYKDIFKSGEFVSAALVTVKYMIVVVVILYVVGILLANTLDKKIPARPVVRSLVLLPWVIPTVITALLWLWLFQPQYGLLNYFLTSLHIIEAPISWVSNPKFALMSVAAAAIWRQLPFVTIMILAGIQGIPQDIYESAVIDGATSRQAFFSITLPMLKGIIKSTMLISIIDNFKQFPLFWIMTGGGPMNKTTSLAVLTYKNSFVNLNFGNGAAVATLWLLILVIFSVVYNKVFKTNAD